MVRDSISALIVVMLEHEMAVLNEALDINEPRQAL